MEKRLREHMNLISAFDFAEGVKIRQAFSQKRSEISGYENILLK